MTYQNGKQNRNTSPHESLWLGLEWFVLIGGGIFSGISFYPPLDRMWIPSITIVAGILVLLLTLNRNQDERWKITFAFAQSLAIIFAFLVTYFDVAPFYWVQSTDPTICQVEARNAAYVREFPTVESDIIGGTLRGSHVDVILGVGDDINEDVWWQVRLDDGTVGWVFSKAVEELNRQACNDSIAGDST